MVLLLILRHDIKFKETHLKFFFQTFEMLNMIPQMFILLIIDSYLGIYISLNLEKILHQFGGPEVSICMTYVHGDVLKLLELEV